MTKKPSNLPYLIASTGALAVIVAAWLGRDRIPSVAPGDAAPDFEAVTLDGRPASLDDFAGKIVLLNIWATWCAPCEEEMPSMQRLYEELNSQGLEVVAVSIDARMGEVDAAGYPGGDIGKFARDHGLTFTILHDPRGRIQRTYMTTGVPESFVIGRDGIIYGKRAGAVEWDNPDLSALIRRLLDEEA
ncbi:MAG: TlpA family protein disulfide reductase [Gemmatimonadetes bacterium]|nr:TlpA family protein disulfide reductase [Gemmatimonadota bacterium]